MAKMYRRPNRRVFGAVLTSSAAMTTVLATAIAFAAALAAAIATAVSAEPSSQATIQEGADARPIVTAIVTPETEAAATRPPKPLSKAARTKRVQRCYAKLGYYKGPIDGKANKKTWTAHWHFKNDHGLKSYGDFLAAPVQKKIEALCQDEPALRTAAKAPVAAGNKVEEAVGSLVETAGIAKETLPSPAEGKSASSPAPRPLGIDCLPEDLIAVLRKAHGASAAKACRPGCLPPPAGLSQKQLDELYGRYGVVWCRSCLQIGGHLSLKDVKRIEEAGKLELCTTPPRQLPRPGAAHGNVVKSFSRIRELYRAMPAAPEDAGAVAVIIGNGAYDNLPPARTARSDAGAMYFFLTEHLGFRQDRVIDLRNAKRTDFERVFGPVPGSDGELKRLVEAQPNAKIVIYYAGHGATNAAQNETYLLPVDAEPYREERSGYPLSTLYANLASIDAESKLVLLDTSFGRDHGSYVLPPNIPETNFSALPPKPLSKLTVLASADRGQRALMDPDFDIGLFTRYLIEGLAGAADLPPVGNNNGRVDSAELYAYTAAMVRRAAQKTYGLLQSPAYSSAAPSVLKAPAALAAGPN